MRGASQTSAVLSDSTSGPTARGSAMRASARSAISRTSASSVRVACTVSSSAGTAFALPTRPSSSAAKARSRHCRAPASFVDVLVHQPQAVVRVEQPLGPLGRAARLLLEHRLQGLEVEQRVRAGGSRARAATVPAPRARRRAAGRPPSLGEAALDTVEIRAVPEPGEMATSPAPSITLATMRMSVNALTAGQRIGHGPAGPVAVEVRHHAVQQEEAGAGRPRGREALLAVGGGHHAIVRARRHAFQDCPLGGSSSMTRRSLLTSDCASSRKTSACRRPTTISSASWIEGSSAVPTRSRIRCTATSGDIFSW